MLRCAITDSLHLGANRTAQRDALLESVRRWAAEGIELIQLREKHLEAGELLQLAQEILSVLHAHGNARPKLLINGRADVAIAARADGVHLTSHPGELTPSQVRDLYAHASLPTPFVSVSCHTLDDVRRANTSAADFVLFGPVFEKTVDTEHVADGTGLELLREACRLAHPVPVLALGGITHANTAACLAARAAGIAAIRLFRP